MTSDFEDRILLDGRIDTVNYTYIFVCGDLNARFGSGTDETKIISDTMSLCSLHCVYMGLLIIFVVVTPL